MEALKVTVGSVELKPTDMDTGVTYREREARCEDETFSHWVRIEER